MKKLIIIPIVFFAFTVQAQQRLFYLNWDINTPTSNTDWLSKSSVAGGKIGYRKFMERVENRLSTGIEFSWTTFSQYEPTQTFENATGAITTDYFKYIYQYTITGSAHYNFVAKENFYVYGGVGLGAMHNKYRIYYNIYTEGEDGWGFLARPEAGIIARIPGKSFGGMAAIHYDISTNKSEYYNYSNFSALGFQIGVVFMTRY